MVRYNKFGLGGLVLNFKYCQISSIAVAFASGLVVNQVVNVPECIKQAKLKREAKATNKELQQIEEDKENTSDA